MLRRRLAKAMAGDDGSTQYSYIVPLGRRSGTYTLTWTERASGVVVKRDIISMG
jgi:hypothetical protein